MHLRLIPKRHQFRYKVFSLFTDIDDLGPLNKKLRLFSLNRFGLISFYSSDHGDRSGKSLRSWVDEINKKEKIIPAEKVFLLSFPRILGFGFSPLSVFFCYRKGKLSSVIYEVKNTFGDQVSYVLDVKNLKGGSIRHSHKKEMYVSPFLDMPYTYYFTLKPPGDKLSLKISEVGEEGQVLIATQNGTFKPLTDLNLFRAVSSYPLMGVKVILAIHWHALRLFIKGLKYYSYSGWSKKKGNNSDFKGSNT